MLRELLVFPALTVFQVLPERVAERLVVAHVREELGEKNLQWRLVSRALWNNLARLGVPVAEVAGGGEVRLPVGGGLLQVSTTDSETVSVSHKFWQASG